MPAHAHLGSLFLDEPFPAARYASELLDDPAMERITRAFPALRASPLLPFVAGWAISGSLYGGLTASLEPLCPGDSKGAATSANPNPVIP
ncbi:hypothetical protein [Nonomuraea sp. NPDC003804]|uniref:hypothetical protein n=1 Tax=Nonomuraea sp. NPDC003804 TaxID=3154547 RepID=UPI0033AFC91C